MKIIYILLDNNKCVSNVFYKKDEKDIIPNYEGMIKTQVDDEMFKELTSNSLGEYYFRDNSKLEKVVKPPKPQDGVRLEYDYENDAWIEKATKDEQLEYCKKEILRNTRELLVYERSGFSNDELQNKIDELVEKHRVLSEDIARAEDKKY